MYVGQDGNVYFQAPTGLYLWTGHEWALMPPEHAAVGGEKDASDVLGTVQRMDATLLKLNTDFGSLFQEGFKEQVQGFGIHDDLNDLQNRFNDFLRHWTDFTFRKQLRKG